MVSGGKPANGPEVEPASRLRDTAEFEVPGVSKVSHFWEPEPSDKVRLEVAGRSDPGKVRPANEDNFLAVKRYRGRELLATSLPENMLEASEDFAYTLAVADGMGGHEFGELASLLALRTGWELGGDEIKWTVKVNDREQTELRQKADIFFQLIHKALHDLARESPRVRGMGTTLTLCYSTGPELFVMHAGDSRAYLFRDGGLTRLTRDHNLAQLLVDSGAAEAGSAEARKMKHMLTNCLGGQTGSVDVDVRHERLQHEDRVLLCTDGLNDMVNDTEIEKILVTNLVPADACRALIDLALKRGARDNVTVIVGRYIFESAPEPTWPPIDSALKNK
jgi:PPM family protein phosphatase